MLDFHDFRFNHFFYQKKVVLCLSGPSSSLALDSLRLGPGVSMLCDCAGGVFSLVNTRIFCKPIVISPSCVGVQVAVVVR